MCYFQNVFLILNILSGKQLKKFRQIFRIHRLPRIRCFNLYYFSDLFYAEIIRHTAKIFRLSFIWVNWSTWLPMSFYTELTSFRLQSAFPSFSVSMEKSVLLAFFFNFRPRRNISSSALFSKACNMLKKTLCLWNKISWTQLIPCNSTARQICFQYSLGVYLYCASRSADVS